MCKHNYYYVDSCFFAVVTVSSQTPMIAATEGTSVQTDVCAFLNTMENTQGVVEVEIVITGGSATGEIIMTRRCSGDISSCTMTSLNWPIKLLNIRLISRLSTLTSGQCYLST